MLRYFQLPQSLYAQHPLPPYARLLGMRRDASALLRAINENARIPVINRPGRALAVQSPVFALDMGMESGAIAAIRHNIDTIREALG